MRSGWTCLGRRTTSAWLLTAWSRHVVVPGMPYVLHHTVVPRLVSFHLLSKLLLQPLSGCAPAVAGWQLICRSSLQRTGKPGKPLAGHHINLHACANCAFAAVLLCVRRWALTSASTA